jgi:tetratricopeptide (TPR) repeat protein
MTYSCVIPWQQFNNNVTWLNRFCIFTAQAEGKYEQSLKKSQKTLEKVESWQDERIKNRPALIANLYSCMGNAYLEMGQYKDALECHNKDYDIGHSK